MPATREEVAAALKIITPLTVAAERVYGVPAELTTTICMVESDWLKKRVGKYNICGMKRAARHKLWVIVETREVLNDAALRKIPAALIKRKDRRPDGMWDVYQDLEFADYRSLQDAVNDQAWLISSGSPYAQAWRAFKDQMEDWQKLAMQVARVYAPRPAGASDVDAYGKLIVQIANQSDVQAALMAARRPAAVIS